MRRTPLKKVGLFSRAGPGLGADFEATGSGKFTKI